MRELLRTSVRRDGYPWVGNCLGPTDHASVQNNSGLPQGPESSCGHAKRGGVRPQRLRRVRDATGMSPVGGHDIQGIEQESQI